MKKSDFYFILAVIVGIIGSTFIDWNIKTSIGFFILFISNIILDLRQIEIKKEKNQ